jgi:hypothetical protein|tara:strand:+ start:833 stop:1555 length:723 start_codon:yes stop_codon:yes gene_type:complete
MKNKIHRISLIIIGSILFSGNIFSNDINLKKADSLFNLKIYTEAKVIYDSLFYKKKMYSESMLLKMALIEEGLENYEKSIYYLSEYQSIKKNESTEDRILKIADNYNLEGYKKNDFEYLQNNFQKNRYLIIMSFLISIILIFTFNIIRILKNKKNPILKTLFYTLIILLIIIININLPKYGIVYFENTFIMEEPSSGSDVYKLVKKGDKLKITNEISVWYEIKINNKKRYVRKKNIKIIN